MGTPDFAVAILDELVRNKASIVGIVTAPDKPSGRGLKLNQSAVKKYAVEQKMTILQPANLKDDVFVDELRSLQADLFVVVAFRMLPEVVWSMPSKGTINLHASILPNYRGAAPIHWAIINGEKETGVTSFYIEKEIDTGKIIDRNVVQIGENETVGELYGRLMQLGASTILKTVRKIAQNEVQAIDQLQLIEGKLQVAPKIFKETCEIHFQQPVAIVHNFVRGLNPFPGAWCVLSNGNDNKIQMKLFACKKTDTPTHGSNSLKISSEGILFPCEDFYLCVTEIQPEGKRKMDFKSYLAGNSIDDLSVVQ